MPAGGGSRQKRAPLRQQADLQDSRLAFFMLSRPGLKKKTEGLQYHEASRQHEAKGIVLLCPPRELLTLRRHHRVSRTTRMKPEAACRSPPKKPP